MVQFVQLVAYYVMSVRDCVNEPCRAWFKCKVQMSAIRSLAAKYIASKMSKDFKELSKAEQDHLVEPIVMGWFQKHPDGSVGTYIAYSPATACMMSKILSIDVGTSYNSEIDDMLDECQTPPAKKAKVCQYVNKKSMETSSASTESSSSESDDLKCSGCGYSGLAQHWNCPAEHYVFISDTKEIHNAIVKLAMTSKKSVETDRQYIMNYSTSSEFRAKTEVVEAPYICSVFLIDIEQFLSNLESKGYTTEELFREDSNVYKISK